MGNKTLIRGTLIILAILAIFTIMMLVLVGKDGLISKEIQNYNDTHVEEDNEKQNNVVIVQK
ncbi:MAG: hypothetical protein IJ890_07200 [Clostridia bacterium]|nr:hypothetical protein [Clostridia bacterium]